MPSTPSRLSLWLTAAAAVVVIGLEEGAPAVQTTTAQAASPDAAAIKDFVDRVNQYVALHKKLEATLPKLPEKATPEQIDQNERALGAMIQSARKTARRGDLFTPAMTVIVRRIMAQVFGGPEGQKLFSSVMEENFKEIPLRVNQRFPEGIPVSTMPPAILKALPELPEQMEYRFVATQFVLLDPHSHLVADFMPGALTIK